VAATLNRSVACAAVLTSRLVAPSAGLERWRTPPAEAAPADAIPPRARRLVLVVFALSGFTSMAQEVIWSRLLVFFQAINAYAFAIILVAFLTGIAGGSFVAAGRSRRRPTGRRVLAGPGLAIAAGPAGPMASPGL